MASEALHCKNYCSIVALITEEADDAGKLGIIDACCDLTLNPNAHSVDHPDTVHVRAFHMH